MVNLPPSEESPILVRRRVRSHHQWGVGRPGVQRTPSVPQTLIELEAMAHKASNVSFAALFHLSGLGVSFKEAMDMLRVEHNMNFKMLCPRCGGDHGYDELVAPER